MFFLEGKASASSNASSLGVLNSKQASNIRGALSSSVRVDMSSLITVLSEAAVGSLESEIVG